MIFDEKINIKDGINTNDKPIIVKIFGLFSSVNNIIINVPILKDIMGIDCIIESLLYFIIAIGSNINIQNIIPKLNIKKGADINIIPIFSSLSESIGFIEYLTLLSFIFI